MIVPSAAQAQMNMDENLAENVLWNCLEAMPDLSALQTSTMWSLSLGASHSYEARSMMLSLFQVLRPRSVIETGTNHGLTSAFMWKLGEAIGAKPRVMTFDVSASTLAPQVWQKLGAAEEIVFVKGDSGQMISQVCKQEQDFVLIDGDHSYAGAERDWMAIKGLLSTRSVVFFDNMQHGGGCGRFFSTLDPLWFHPEMAFVARALSVDELRSVFATYIHRLMPLWLGAITSRQGDEIRRNVRSLLELMENPLKDAASYRQVADLCKDLSSDSDSKDRPRLSELVMTSARFGIGTPAQARRQRIRESLPAWLNPWASRIYSLLKQRQ
jgi:predicted O-methyltransferase YrrM